MQPIYLFHLVSCKLEIEDLHVFLDSRRSHRFGQNYISVLDIPPQADLCRRPIMSFRDVFNYWILY